MRSSLLAIALLILTGSVGAGREMQPPRLSSAQVDWSEAVTALADIDVLRVAALGNGRRAARTGRTLPPVVARLNAIMSSRFPGVAISPVPVLLPFDVSALMRDQAAGTASLDNHRYLFGFQSADFFYPGPSGYDAVFTIRTAEVPELSDAKFSEPIAVLISGSALLYELDDPSPATGSPVSALEAEFPGIRRLMHEHHLRYTFVRFGVPYVVSTACFNASVPRGRMPTCKTADQVLLRLLRSLRVVGGTPQPPRYVQALPIERPRQKSPTFSYHTPGRLLSGTGFRGQGGRADYTVYVQMRFPLAEGPAYTNSQMFQSRNRPLQPEQTTSPNYSYPWRDNFCERRGFSVGQCPAGIGHQGEDVRPTPCQPAPGADRCTNHHDLVAVRDGAILRAPRQEAAYLVVNTETEHIRFRYLHMSPSKMDQDNVLSGRRVNEGEVIGQVGNYSKREGGTSYHLHFDIQVPTRDGWVFVNPYMTLVASYERLIGGRGEEISDAMPEVAVSAPLSGIIGQAQDKLAASIQDKPATATQEKPGTLAQDKPAASSQDKSAASASDKPAAAIKPVASLEPVASSKSVASVKPATSIIREEASEKKSDREKKETRNKKHAREKKHDREKKHARDRKKGGTRAVVQHEPQNQIVVDRPFGDRNALRGGPDVRPY